MFDKFMSAKRQKLLFPKLEKASLSACSLMYSGKNSVTKIGFFPFSRGPDSCFWKLKIISLSPRRLWPFLIQKLKWTWTWRKKFYTECLFLWHPQFLEYEKIFDSRNFFGSISEQSKCPSRDFSFMWAAFSSSRALCYTSLAAQNFLKGPNRNMSAKEEQLIDCNNSLLVVEIMLFLLCVYGQLKNLMNRLWLQLFDYCHLIQVFL